MKILLEKFCTWANHLEGSFLPHHLAIQALSTTIPYPTGAIWLSISQLLKILSPAITAPLQMSGIGGDMPSTFQLGPTLYQGLGLPALYVTLLYMSLSSTCIWRPFCMPVEHKRETRPDLFSTAADYLKCNLAQRGFFSSSVSLRRCGPFVWGIPNYPRM
jgi:hypothetical protein